MSERDEVIFREPIKAQKDVKVKIQSVENTEWKPKQAVMDVANAEGKTLNESYKAVKLSVTITDDTVQCENPDATPRSQIDDQFNIQRYPFVDNKKGGVLGWMNRGKLFQLETAFGFDPCFEDKDGQPIEAAITRNGNKVAPKVDGVARVLNPSFVGAYMNEDGTINPSNWVGKEIRIDAGIEKSEQYGDKNVIKAYKKGDLI